MIFQVCVLVSIALIFQVAYIYLSRHDFQRMSFLVLSLFVHVFPLLIGLACIDVSRLVFSSRVSFQTLFVHWFFKSRTLILQHMIGYVSVLVLSLFLHVVPLLIGLTCIDFSRLDFSSRASFQTLFVHELTSSFLCKTSLWGFS